MKFHLNNLIDKKISSNILDILNDDCIREIFRLLPREDLISVADVCTRFQNNAKVMFATRFTNVHIKPFNDQIELERLFRIFGLFIKSIVIHGLLNQNDYDKVFSLLATYCSTKKCMLEELRYERPGSVIEYEYGSKQFRPNHSISSLKKLFP